MSETVTELKGVVCVLTDPKGYVWGVGYDFEPGASAGLDQKRMNEMRAERRAAYEMAKAAMPAALLEGFDGYDIENLARRLLNKGWKLHTRYIGYADDEG